MGCRSVMVALVRLFKDCDGRRNRAIPWRRNGRNGTRECWSVVMGEALRVDTSLRKKNAIPAQDFDSLAELYRSATLGLMRCETSSP